jgi:hypothetical protein
VIRIYLRCQDCGYDYDLAGAGPCGYCGGDNLQYWCNGCQNFLAEPRCPSHGGLREPGPVRLDAALAGTPLAFSLALHNIGAAEVHVVLQQPKAVHLEEDHLVIPERQRRVVRGTLATAGMDPGEQVCRIRPHGRCTIAFPVAFTLLATRIPADFPEVLDFGEWVLDGPREHSFTLTSRHSEPLDLLLEIEQSWLQVKSPTLHLEAGASAAVAVVLQPAEVIAGRLVGGVRLRWGGVVGRVEVRADALLPGPRLAPLAPLELGETSEALLERKLVLHNVGQEPLHARLSSAQPWLRVLPTRVKIAPGQTGTVRVVLRPDPDAAGPIESHLRLRYTRPEGEQSVKVPVRLTRPMPVLKIRPDRIDLGQQVVDTDCRGRVELVNSGQGRLRVRLSAEGTGLSVTPEQLVIPGGSSRSARFLFVAAGLDEGEWKGRIVLETNIGPHEVPMEAQVVGPRLGRIRTQNLRTLEQGAPCERGFRIANDGFGVLTCRVSTPTPWLRVLTPEVRVRAGRRARVRYEIDPGALAVGEHRGMIRLEADDTEGEVPIRVEIIEPRGRLEEVAPVELGSIMDPAPVGFEVPLYNLGPGVARGRAPDNLPWLEWTPPTFTLAPDERMSLLGVFVPSAAPLGPVRHEVVLPMETGLQPFQLRCENVQPRLAVESMLDLGSGLPNTTVSAILVLRNVGIAALQGAVRETPFWASVTPEDFRLEPGEACTLAVRAETGGLLPGTARGALLIEAHRTTHEVALRLEVLLPPPRLGPIAPLNLGHMLGGWWGVRPLWIRNVGSGVLTGTARGEPPWLEVVPDRFEVAADRLEELHLQIDADRLLLGPAAGSVVLHAGGEEVRVPVTLTRVPPPVELPEGVALGEHYPGERVQVALPVRNVSGGPVTCLLTCDRPGVVLRPDRFALEAGARQEVSCWVDLTEWSPGEERFTISLEEVQGTRQFVSVGVEVRRPTLGLAVQPASVDLGLVDPGEERRLALRLTNWGPVPVRMPDWEDKGQAEVWVPGCEVPNDGSMRVEAVFRPGPSSIAEKPCRQVLAFSADGAEPCPQVELRWRVRARPSPVLTWLACLAVFLAGLLTAPRLLEPSRSVALTAAMAWLLWWPWRRPGEGVRRLAVLGGWCVLAFLPLPLPGGLWNAGLPRLAAIGFLGLMLSMAWAPGLWRKRTWPSREFARVLLGAGIAGCVLFGSQAIRLLIP